MTAVDRDLARLSDPAAAEAWLAALADRPDEAIDLAPTALVLAALDQSGVDLGAPLRHLDDIAAAARAAAGDPAAGIEARTTAIGDLLFAGFGYTGDRATYDDPRNADLLHVVERRKGLPVALSILYLHAARAAGLVAEGINLPGHFVVRVADALGARFIVDPFDGGRRLDAAALRSLLKATLGPDAELSPGHLEVAGNRAILLRLLNNLKMRALRPVMQGAGAEAGEGGDGTGEARAAAARAETLARRMLHLAPGNPTLWHEVGILAARQGRLVDALDAMHQAERSPAADADTRYRVATLIQALETRLN